MTETSASSPLASSGAAAESGFSDRVTPEGTSLCPARAAQTWIAIELYDHEGEPCPGEPYRLTLADGTVLDQLRLDQAGRARHEDVPAGECLVEFPEREPLRADDNPKDAFELELLDERGQPAAREPYLLVLADGTRLEGELDEQGKLRLEDIAPGFVRVYFPERPGHRWEPT